MATSFGPSALATPANAITTTRVVLTPVLLVSILGTGASWPALALWVVLAATDGVDGYLARRQGTTRSGAFLDPLADKLLVIGAMLALVARGTFTFIPVALVATREVAMSLYRSVVGRHGVSVPARWSGKVKTVTQDVAVGLALLPVGDDGRWWAASTALWLAVALTLWSGAQYLLDARREGPIAV